MGCVASLPKAVDTAETVAFKSNSKKELRPSASSDRHASKIHGIAAVADPQNKVAVDELDPMGQGDSPNSFQIRAEGKLLTKK